MLLLLCIFRPLILLALDTQSGHWVDGVSCFVFGLVLWSFAWISTCCRVRFDSSWVRVFIDVPIANDADALLQDRVLVLCGVGTRHDDVVVIFVAMDADRDGMVRVFEDSLDDVDALFVQKNLHGLDILHTQSSLCGFSDDV